MAIQLDIGSWGLFCGPGARQLVRVDDVPCGPVSARKATQTIPRRLLLDEGRVAGAARAGEAVMETVVHNDQAFTVAVRVIMSPLSATPIAVLAVVVHAGEPVPDPPLVGSWEWSVERDHDGQPTPRRRTYWDRNLFRLYDVDSSVVQQRLGHWEAGEWANALIDQADQMRVNSSIRDGIQDGLAGVTGVVRCLTYNIVSGYGSQTRGRKHLRLVGSIPPIEDHKEFILMQGVSYEIPDDFHDMAFERNADGARVDDVLRGVLELVREPMAVVDATTLDVLMTSPAWRREDFGHVGGLGEFSIDASGRLRAFIEEVAEDMSSSRSMKVDLRRTDGSVQRVLLTATGVRSGIQGQDAVIRLDL